jgi:hypothetical protein
MNDDSIDNPLDDQGSLKEQLERIPLIVRFQYPLGAQYIIGLFDPLMQRLNELFGMLQQVRPAGRRRRLCRRGPAAPHAHPPPPPSRPSTSSTSPSSRLN